MLILPQSRARNHVCSEEAGEIKSWKEMNIDTKKFGPQWRNTKIPRYLWTFVDCPCVIEFGNVERARDITD